MLRPVLTIAIPTWNRNDILAENIKNILIQLNDQCLVVVRDNFSDIPVQLTFDELGIKHKNLSVVRNNTNIGGNANIVRCYEECKTEWLWVLGDDDMIDSNAVNRILEDINLQPDAIQISYQTPYVEEKHLERKIYQGLDDLISNIVTVHSLILISSNVVNAKVLIKQVSIGYQYAYSCVPHLAMLIRALLSDSTQKTVISPEYVVHFQPTLPEHAWSILTVALAVPVVLELPMPSVTRRKLDIKLRASNTLILRYGISLCFMAEKMVTGRLHASYITIFVTVICI